MLNITRIPAPRVALVDSETGLMSREWFRFFNNIYTIVGANLGVIQIENGGTGLSTAPTNGQLLIGDTVNGYVLNTLNPADGITVTNGAGTITLTNTGVLSFSGGNTGLTPATATNGNVVISGLLNVASGGTNQSSYVDGELLIGNTTGNTLTKSTLTAGTAIGISNGAGAITITNTLPDQTVVLTNGTGISITGTYPSFTITNTSPSSGGTVTSITAGTGLTGGTITTSGTIAIDSTVATLTGTQTLTNKTLTSPKANEILDTNGNESVVFSPTTSATDYFVMKNGIGVGVPLHLYADGSSANTGVHIQPKGTGLVTISDGTDFSKGIRFRSSSSAASAITLLDAVSSAGRVVTLPDATTTLVGRDTTDTLTNKSISGATNTLSSIGNASLTNSTISGVALGGNLFDLTAGTGVSFSAGTTYNGSAAITINATGTGGTVTSVTGTAPVAVATGTTTPVISMAQATGSVDGYLSSTDWTTFNNKSNTNGTVTSVAALTLGTTGTDLSSTVANGTTTPVITLNVPTASATNRGALSAADWSTFNGKQAALVSGTNIKTVGGVSLLGSGDVGTIGVGYGGTGTSTAFTTGAIVFAGASGVYSQNSSNLFWDNSNGRLGIGTATPATPITVYRGAAANTYIRVQNTAADVDFGVDGGGTAVLWNNASTRMAFGVVNEVMRLYASGGVSIGNTTDPGATNLSVTGTGKFTGGIVGSAIGATTPSTGAFTTISATSTGATNATFGSSSSQFALYAYNSVATIGAFNSNEVIKIQNTNTTANNQACIGFYDGNGAVVSEIASVNINHTTHVADLTFATRNAGAFAERMRISATGNIYGVAGTTGMTNGFFYIPAAAGAPTGAPTAITGTVPMYYDTTNNFFYVYNGAWKKILLA